MHDTPGRAPAHPRRHAAATPSLRPALALALLVATLAAACGRGPTPRRDRAPAPADTTRAAAPHRPAPDADSLGAPDSLAAAEAEASSADGPAPARWTRWPITGPRSLATLRDSLGAARFLEVLALNRLDLAHARQGDTLVVPAGSDSLLALSPFPARWAALDSLPKALLVSLRVQAWAAYAGGRLARWGPVSTGRRAKPTPAGLYHTNWRERQRLSTIDESWLLKWYVNLHNRQGVSFHEYEMPGRPASHSCVRLLAADAEWLFGWCDTWALTADRRGVTREGTPVVVFGAWDWDGRRPWKRLPEDPRAVTLAPDELGEALRVLRERVEPDFAAIGADSAAAAPAPEPPGPRPPR